MTEGTAGRKREEIAEGRLCKGGLSGMMPLQAWVEVGACLQRGVVRRSV